MTVLKSYILGDVEHQRAIPGQRVSRFAKELNVLSYNMSAKTGESVGSFFMDMVAKYIGIPLTKAERDYQQSVIKAELTTQESDVKKKITVRRANNNTSVCSIQ